MGRTGALRLHSSAERFLHSSAKRFLHSSARRLTGQRRRAGAITTVTVRLYGHRNEADGVDSCLTEGRT